MSSFQLSAPLRCTWSTHVFAGNKKPRLLQRRGQIPAVPPCLDTLGLASLALSVHSRRCYRPPPRRGLLSQPTDCSPARLRGEFGNLLAPVLHLAPALWSTTPCPSYSSRI